MCLRFYRRTKYLWPPGGIRDWLTLVDTLVDTPLRQPEAGSRFVLGNIPVGSGSVHLRRWGHLHGNEAQHMHTKQELTTLQAHPNASANTPPPVLLLQHPFRKQRNSFMSVHPSSQSQL